MSAPLLWLLHPAGFRYSASRDAYILRIVGKRFGPVLKPTRRVFARGAMRPAVDVPAPEPTLARHGARED